MKLDEVMVQVIDKGIGIPFADQEHIFDRFYTVDKAHSQKMGGSGLGPVDRQNNCRKTFWNDYPTIRIGQKDQLLPFDSQK